MSTGAKPPASTLDEIADLLADCIAGGMQAIIWVTETGPLNRVQIALLSLLRHVLEMLDGCLILAREASCGAMKPLLRSTAEAVASLLYILQADTENRANALYVGDVHRRISYYERLDPETPSGKQLRAQKKLADAFDFPIFPSTDTRSTIEDARAELSHEPLKAIEEEWQRTKKKKIKSVRWYALFEGPTNVEGLFKRVGWINWYELFYRDWSNAVHASDTFENFEAEANQKGKMATVRYSANLGRSALMAIGFFLMAFNRGLSRLAPQRLPEFGVWYKRTIRSRYLVLEA